MVHANTSYELRDHILPTIRRSSRKMQSIIIRTTEQYRKMQEYKDVINESCLSTSLVIKMSKLSRNLTEIMLKDVPLIEKELNYIIIDIEELKKEIDQLMNKIKQEKVTLEHVEHLQRLTNNYQKLNDQINKFTQQLTPMLNEIISPGLILIDKYNTCLSSTAQSLIDHSLDQIVEYIDDDDDHDDQQLFSLEHLSLPNNHTEL
ncbi:unnamed protein product [Adineta steineri]|uniref:Uncharacterized protein n=1 Tax=Adineta steineri TaxID=433720 RepID=A0A813SMQ3_9BILA|nr:unnamed protein product [Adineta steineri]